MSGGTMAHSLIAANLAGELPQKLKNTSCRVLNSDARIHVHSSGLYTYPDVSVVCGEPVFLDDQRDTVTNPTLIVEVLSESTRRYDRGEKFHLYRQITALAEYLCVAQDKIYLEQWTRQAGGQWLLTETKSEAETVTFASLDIQIAIAEFFAKVDFQK